MNVINQKYKEVYILGFKSDFFYYKLTKFESPLMTIYCDVFIHKISFKIDKTFGVLEVRRLIKAAVTVFFYFSTTWISSVF